MLVHLGEFFSLKHVHVSSGMMLKGQGSEIKESGGGKGGVIRLQGSRAEKEQMGT